MHKGQIPTQLQLRVLDFCGREALGDRWSAVVAALERELAAGATGPAVHEQSWTYYFFADLPLAVASWDRALGAIRGEDAWSSAELPLPVQVLLVAEGEEAGATRYREHPLLWDGLQPETVYLTPALVQRWEVLLDRERDTHLSIVDEPHRRLSRIERDDGVATRWLCLFPGRTLPWRQRGRQCFYCGLRNHHPRDCPSRYLGPEVHGISRVGYQSLPEFSLHYGKAFADQRRLCRVMSQGVEAKQLRADPALQAYVAYFDLNRVYQLRYLFHLSFSYLEGWPGLGPLSALRAAGGSTLYMGLDCLRVGNREQAVGMLRSLAGVNSEQRFGVEVGLAFAALEEDMPEAMAEHLGRAAKYAQRPEERVYAGLLLSRFHEVFGGAAGVGRALSAAYDILGRCHESEYRLIQLSAGDGAGETLLEQLRALIQRDRQYFYVALMDPHLAPLRGPLDTLLASLLEHSSRAGREQYEQLRAECEAVRAWVGADDRTMESVAAGVASLGERLAQDSYFAYSDVLATAKRLSDSCQAVRERKVAALLRTLDGVRRRRERLEQRWQAYPYRRFYPKVPELLAAVRGANEAATTALIEEDLAAYREADRLLEKALAQLTELEELWPEMVWLQRALVFTRRFGVRLLVSEAAAVLLCVLALPAMALWARQAPEGVFGVLFGSGNFRRLALFAAVFGVAPALALVTSLPRSETPKGG